MSLTKIDIIESVYEHLGMPVDVDHEGRGQASLQLRVWDPNDEGVGWRG